MKSSKFSIIQVLAVIDCSILLKSHYIIQLLRYVIHAMRNLFEVRTMAAILIFTTHAIDACGISYETGFNCVVHAFFWELMCGRCCTVNIQLQHLVEHDVHCQLFLVYMYHCPTIDYSLLPFSCFPGLHSCTTGSRFLHQQNCFVQHWRYSVHALASTVLVPSKFSYKNILRTETDR